MTEDLELEWARDLFDRTRGAGEPVWTADAMVLARSGDRRRRLRTAGAGGGLAGVVAVTAAVAVGLGAGTADLGSQPGPGGGWGNRPLAEVFKHTDYLGPVDKSLQAYAPEPAVADLAAVMGRLDPSLSHIVGKSDDVRVVSAGDAEVKQATAIGMSSVWITDAPRPAGQLSFQFASPGGSVPSVATGVLGTDQLTGPCALAVGHDQGLAGAGITPSVSVKWSACAQTHLADGSTIGTASVRIGEGTAMVAVRQFFDGEVFSVIATDFWTSGRQGSVPDPTTVVHPTPWSEQSLAAALADPAVAPGWHPIPPPDSDGRLLQPADLGKGWAFDTSGGVGGSPLQYQIANGCVPTRTVPVAKAGSEARYWGQLPDGISGTVYEGEFPFRAGTGAQTMAQVRSAAQNGCKGKNGPVDYSGDKVVPLPAGIGDEAFEADVPGLGMVSVVVRIGDTILRADVTNAAYAQDAIWTEDKPLDLSSAADQQWLVNFARAMVSRYHAGMTGH